jgi:hypothetical protein
LIGAEPDRRVALDVLDRLVPLACGKLYVRRGDVVLQIDELLGAASACVGRRDEPQRSHGLFRRYRYRRARDRRAVAVPGAPRGIGTACETFADAFMQLEAAVARANRAFVLHRFTGHVARTQLIVPGSAAGLCMQVHDRAPAAGYANDIASDRACRPRYPFPVGC